MSTGSRTLTVILNSNHSKRFALSLKHGDATPATTILRDARNKFRSKGLSAVFLRGGVQLEDASVDESFTEVWVTKGEPYNGPPAREGLSDHLGDVRVIAEKSFIDEQAIKQLNAIAVLPGVRLAVGLPDLHPGNRFPVGCAIAAGTYPSPSSTNSATETSLVEDGIYPALIGSDVGCGIALYHFNPSSRSLPHPSKVAPSLRGLDEPWSGSVSDWLANYGITRSSAFDNSLGTVGAGNHFAEICTVERIVDEALAESIGVRDGGVYLLGSDHRSFIATRPDPSS